MANKAQNFLLTTVLIIAAVFAVAYILSWTGVYDINNLKIVKQEVNPSNPQNPVVVNQQQIVPQSVVACGKDAAFTITAKDLEASSVTGTNVPVYVVRYPYNAATGVVDPTPQLTNPAGTTVVPIGTSFSSGFKTCDVVDIIGFNATYYGDWLKGWKVSQGDTILLNLHKIAPTGNFRWLLGSSNVFTSEAPGAVNLTLMTASASNSLRKIEMRINGTYMSYNLGELYVDTVVGTNISTISFTGTPSSSKAGIRIESGGYLPGRSGAISAGRQDQANFQFKVFDGSNPWLMHSGDFIDVVNNQFTVSGNGCSSTAASGTADSMRVFATDIQKYVSRDGSNIYEGVESDAPTPVDVGSGDTNSQFFYCISTSGG